jgi:hypothetical protein
MNSPHSVPPTPPNTPTNHTFSFDELAFKLRKLEKESK